MITPLPGITATKPGSATTLRDPEVMAELESKIAEEQAEDWTQGRRYRQLV